MVQQVIKKSQKKRESMISMVLCVITMQHYLVDVMSL
jgi:hypothetical protein